MREKATRAVEKHTWGHFASLTVARAELKQLLSECQTLCNQVTVMLLYGAADRTSTHAARAIIRLKIAVRERVIIGGSNIWLLEKKDKN